LKKQGIPQQLIPLAIIFALTIAALVVARKVFVPPTFGDLGHYRAASIEENASLEISYAGVEACAECHDDVVATKQNSLHKGVSCEVCHGPAADHVEAPDEHTPRAPRERGYCPLCHGYQPARPSGFPQIIPAVHNPGKPCMECHNPHNPLLPRAPEECSACHRDIASVKIVSHHANVECIQCHTVDPKHKQDPKHYAAQRPTTVAVCGKCHAEDAEGRRSIPRIDIQEHGKRYLCWDCHYPHYPEAN